MKEKCKTCKKEFKSGIWLAPEFTGEKVLLFCSEKCKNEYIKGKLMRIKSNYPDYYKKLIEDKERYKNYSKYGNTKLEE
jgi:hypothetical protein